MIDFVPTDEQTMLVDAVRRFVRDEIVPLEQDLDPDAGSLPPADHARLAAKVEQLGLTAWDAPAEVGGPGLDTVTRTLLAIEMAQHRGGLYTPCYGVFGGAGLAQLYEAGEDLRERYLYPTLRGERHGFFALTEPSGGSDPARAVRTKAVRDGDEWVINGSKTFISGVVGADYGIVVCRTGSGRAGLTSFVVDADTPGFTVHRVIPTLRRVAVPTELSFTDVRVPDANRLGEVGQGFRLAATRLERQRIVYAAGCVGVAVAAQRMAVEYAKIRETFGRTLAEHQGVQWMLVDSELDLRSARLLLLEAAAAADRGERARAGIALAKMAATEAASRVVDRAIQIHGALGVAADLPLERWYREMRIRRIGEGPTETQRMVVARELLGDAARAGKAS
ncbi:acyl-CoA dehydrogenase family protein [Actinomadura atramentaria]|uniref:acyl-CoA dehydrogenase family protein n=1 Tax=Actinomadura atramentaria TaxID=1990 RepID=UPI00036328B1|nr:acyl-CoA dehydrogenase family protein [Actinomadura atramentaria]